MNQVPDVGFMCSDCSDPQMTSPPCGAMQAYASNLPSKKCICWGLSERHLEYEHRVQPRFSFFSIFSLDTGGTYCLATSVCSPADKLGSAPGTYVDSFQSLSKRFSGVCVHLRGISLKVGLPVYPPDIFVNLCRADIFHFSILLLLSLKIKGHAFHEHLESRVVTFS